MRLSFVGNGDIRMKITRTIANLIDYHVDDDNCFDDFDATTASPRTTPSEKGQFHCAFVRNDDIRMKVRRTTANLISMSIMAIALMIGTTYFPRTTPSEKGRLEGNDHNRDDNDEQ